MQKLYRMSEAAEILGVTVKTLQRWDKLGKDILFERRMEKEDYQKASFIDYLDRL